MADLLALVRTVLTATPEDAWAALFEAATQTLRAPLADAVAAEVQRREDSVGQLDALLASAAWDLWADYEASVRHTADALAEWWSGETGGRAVLVLDALSLRELPWLLAGAAARGYTVERAHATGAELPTETNAFARALGVSQRSSLQSEGAPAGLRLVGAATDVLGVPFEDAAALVPARPSVLVWHSWLDDRIHGYFHQAGRGLADLTRETASVLTGDAFWTLIARLTQGRRLVITSDHGYAASGGFPDATTSEGDALKAVFGRGRSSRLDAGATPGPGAFVPPLMLTLDTRTGRYVLALGRRKWRSQAGYPTLTHGGLSLLEACSPFLIVSRPAGPEGG